MKDIQREGSEYVINGSIEEIYGSNTEVNKELVTKGDVYGDLDFVKIEVQQGESDIKNNGLEESDSNENEEQENLNNNKGEVEEEIDNSSIETTDDEDTIKMEMKQDSDTIKTENEIDIDNAEIKVEQVIEKLESLDLNDSQNKLKEKSNHERMINYSKVLGLPSKHLKKEQELQLNIDMITLFETVTPSKTSYQKRIKLLNKVQDILEYEYPDTFTKAFLFGSTENTLGMKMSDVDICIITSWHEITNVRILAKTLKKHGFSNILCIAEAKVPIIKAWDPQLKLACDINVNNPMAIDNTQLIKCYAALDPRVRPFAITVKYWAKQRVLNDAAAGGTLSTYSWVNLILNFLQTRDPPILPVLHSLPFKDEFKNGVNVGFFKDIEMLQGFGLANKETLGGLLYSFFRRFAYEFDYENEVVSLRTGKILSKEEKGWVNARGNHYFCIEEPFNLERNIANSADEISVLGLIEEFKRACNILSRSASLLETCQPFTTEESEELSQFDYRFLDLYEEDLFAINEHILRINSNKQQQKTNNDVKHVIKFSLKEGDTKIVNIKNQNKSGSRNSRNSRDYNRKKEIKTKGVNNKTRSRNRRTESENLSDNINS